MRRIRGNIWQMGLAALALALVAPSSRSIGLAAPPSEPRWSVVLTTAPHHPQDVWFAATGNNTEGWTGGGCICLGPLAQGLGPGDHATALVEVLEGGVYGVDGMPVPDVDYFAPGIPFPLGPRDGPGEELPGRDFVLTPGRTYYLITRHTIVESNLDRFGLPQGLVITAMFTFDFDPDRLGRSDQLTVNWADFGFGFFPFLDEGVLMTNLRLHR